MMIDLSIDLYFESAKLGFIITLVNTYL